MKKSLLLICLVYSSLANLYSQEDANPSTEIRATWITTNWQLDWPEKGTSTQKQKQELISILDKLKAANFNLVLFQVRSQGATFYNSKIEPRSLYLNNDKFDPLAFAIAESHKRGLECHAWIVVYPMGSSKLNSQIGRTKTRAKKPEYYIQFKGEWYLDPGHPKTNDYILSIAKEIVSNYDVDGIHLDYIRYPDKKFPDNKTYKKYGKGKALDRWRRDNINKLIYKIYDTTKSIKKWVQVSSSPLGKYKGIENTGTTRGWTAFEAVYQDPIDWLEKEKQDIVFPMMYYKDSDFFPYLNDWLKNNHNRLIVPGLGAYQLLSNEADWELPVIEQQVDYLRQKGIGQAYFRAGNIIDNTKGLKDLVKNRYKNPAKLPPMKWLSSNIPSRPKELEVYKNDEGFLQIKWEAPDDGEYNYTIYVSHQKNVDKSKGQHILETGIRGNFYSFEPSIGAYGFYYTVTAIDRYHNESELAFPAFFSHLGEEQ